MIVLVFQEAVQGRDEVEEKLSQAAQSAQLGSVVQLQLQQTEKRNAALQVYRLFILHLTGFCLVT